MIQLKEEGANEDIDLYPALLDYYQRHMRDGTFVSYIALDHNEIIATSGISFVEKPPYYSCINGKIGLLSSMYTKKEYRRQHIATTLLEKIMQEAKDYGCSTVQITASNMGVSLYSHYGFIKSDNFMYYQL